MLINLSHQSDSYHRSKHYKDRAYLRSLSTFPHHDLEKASGSQPPQFSRLLSHHHHHYMQEYLDDFPMTREEFLRSFHRGDTENDSEGADDEDDERTPTVERSEPKFK